MDGQLAVLVQVERKTLIGIGVYKSQVRGRHADDPVVIIIGDRKGVSDNGRTGLHILNIGL